MGRSESLSTRTPARAGLYQEGKDIGLGLGGENPSQGITVGLENGMERGAGTGSGKEMERIMEG